MSTTLSVSNYRILEAARFSALSQTESVGNTTLNLFDASNFTPNTHVLVGEFGQTAELKKFDGVFAQSVNLEQGLDFSHPQGETVYNVLWDVIEFYYAPDLNSSLTFLGSEHIDVRQEYTTHYDYQHESGYLYVRFKNTNALTGSNKAFSNYSAPIPYRYDRQQAGAIAHEMERNLNQTLGERITYEDVFDAINQAEDEIRRSRRVGWSFLYEPNQIVGELQTGQWEVSLPNDIYSSDHNVSIYHVHLGRETPLRWVDNETFFGHYLFDIAYSQLDGAVNANDNTIDLIDATDFNESGTVRIEEDLVTYTGKSGNTLTGVSGLNNSHADGTWVFSPNAEGTPRVYTITQGTLKVYPIAGTSLRGRNVYMSYERQMKTIRNTADFIDVPDVGLIQLFVQHKLLERLNNGAPTSESDQLYQHFADRLREFRRQQTAPIRKRLIPRIPRIGRAKYAYGYLEGTDVYHPDSVNEKF